MTKKRNDATYIAGPHKVKDSRDYYTKLWDSTKGRGTKDNNVRVRVRRGNVVLLDELVLEVQVQSQVMRGRIKMGEMSIKRNEPLSDMRVKACTLAGALAEQVCQSFGDNYDPSDFAKAGGEAFDQIVEKLTAGDLTQGTLLA